MGKLKYLTKNIALFSISNFVSKILVFLLVPLYTNVLTTYEYGIADIIQVTLLLLVPMVTVNIGEAALRFGVEEADNRPEILRVGVKYVVRAISLVAIVCIDLVALLKFADGHKIGDAISRLIAGGAGELTGYLWIFIILFAANAFYEFFVLYYQGAERVEIIVIGSITCTVATIGFNILFLLIVKIGLYGYLFSQIFAYAIASVVMLILSGNLTPYSHHAHMSADDLEKRMITYSRPMVVYSTASWINNAVDRYFVLYMCGAAINGVYGVAYKIPAILMVFQRIFAQAWQLSATKAHKDEDSDEFFTDMYRVYNSFMVIGCAGLILLVKPVSAFLFRKDFYEAWKLVPPLLISVIFGALTGFTGSICLAHKDSKSMGRATGIGALVNVVLNLILIPYMSAMGAAVATAISYFTMSTLALAFVKRHVTLKISIVRNLVSYVLLITQALIMILELPYHYVICAAIVLILILLYMSDFIKIIYVLISKLRPHKES